MKVVLCYVTWDSFKPASAFEMINLTGTGLFQSAFCGCGTLLPIARNHVTRAIYKVVPDFTHVLYVDSDMVGVDGPLVQSLLESDKDFISPVITMREPPYTPAIPPESCNLLLKSFDLPIDKRQLIEVPRIGLACALIKRQVLDKVAFKAGPEICWFDCSNEIREGFEDECQAELKELELGEYADENDIIKKSFLRGVKLGVGAYDGGIQYGEDYKFCKRVTYHGFKIFLDPRLGLGHLGHVAYGVEDWMALVNNEGIPLQNRVENATYVWSRDERSIKRLTN